MSATLVEPADAGDRSAPFPWRSKFNPQLHLGVFRTIARSIVKLGIMHNNYIVQASVNNWGTSNGVKVQARKLPELGTFEVAVLQADNSDATQITGTAVGGAGPFNVTPGQTTKFKIDGGAVQTKTWTGTAAHVLSVSANYIGLNGNSVTISVNGGAPVVVTFGVGDTTRNAVLATLLAAGIPNFAPVASGGSEIDYASGTIGTGSSIQFVAFTGAGTATALGLPGVGTYTGTGDAANLAAMTALEARVALNALPIVGATAKGILGAIAVSTNTPGAAGSVQHDATSTANLGFDNLVHAGAGAEIELSFVAHELASVP